METKVESLEDNKVKVTVTISADEVNDRINKTYKDFARKYNFPGFRKGKAPRPVVDTALGAEAVLATVTDELVNGAYPEVIEAEGLFPQGQPVVEENDKLVTEGEDYTFVMNINTRPQIELDSYEPVEIEIPFAEATETEVQNQIASLLEHYSTYEDSSAATKIKPENYADLAIKATDEEGNVIDALSSESRLYGPGTGILSADFDAEIMGMKKGQTKEFTLEIPEDETAALLADQAGKKVNFEVTCLVVKKLVEPEITDEWVKETMGFETADEMRQNIKESLDAEKANIMPRLKENAIMAQLLKRYDGVAPGALVAEAESALLQDFFNQIQRVGMTFDAFLAAQGLTRDDFKEDLKRQANDHVLEELALEAWARNKGMEITPELVSAEFVKSGVEDPAGLEAEWRAAGNLHLIRSGLARQLAIADLLENAVVTEVDYAAKIAEEQEKQKKAKKKTTSKKKTAAKKDEKKEETAEE